MTNTKLKNIGIFAHVDAGKTTLTEQLLYKSGVSRFLGTVDDGNTHTDAMDLERERGISITSTPISFNYGGQKINIIDTPGHVDFIAEVERSMIVLDAAILVISAKEGVQSHTKLLFNTLKRLKVPTLIYVNKIDRMGVNTAQVIKEFKSLLSGSVIKIQNSYDEGSKNCRVSDLFEYEKENVLDTLSTVDDEVLEKYMIDDNIGNDYINKKIIEHTASNNIFPLIFGSAMHGIGVNECLDAIVTLFPCYDCDYDKPVSGIVFKVNRDHLKIKELYIKLTSGHIGVRELVGEDKVTKIESLVNGNREKVSRLYAGDIGIIQGLHSLKVGEHFGSHKDFHNVRLAKPTLKVKIMVDRPSLRKELLDALVILAEADPYLEFQLNEFNDDIYLSLFGNVQMEIISETLKRRFGLEVSFKDPMTIYMETICSPANAEVKIYKDGLPFRAGVGFRIEPMEVGTGIIYESEITTGFLKRTFQNAVEEGVREYIDQGLKGWELTDMKITLESYTFNSVDSTPKDYRDLSPLVLFDAIKKAGTRLLWPINSYKLTIPSDLIGKAISDLSKMKATFSDPVIRNDMYEIEGEIPVELSSGYQLEVHGYTSGKGYFETKFHGYQPAPEDIDKEREKFKIDPANRGKYLLYKLNGI